MTTITISLIHLNCGCSTTGGGGIRVADTVWHPSAIIHRRIKFRKRMTPPEHRAGDRRQLKASGIGTYCGGG